MLRDAEILIADGNSIAATGRRLGITEQTYYRWRKEYGGMKVESAKRIKELEKENCRLKKLLAEAAQLAGLPPPVPGRTSGHGRWPWCRSALHPRLISHKS